MTSLLPARGGRACLLALVAGALVAGGCNSRPVVSGTVSYKSAPLTAGEVSLISATGASRSGQIASDGRFEVIDAPPGEVTVVVVSTRVQAPGAGGSPLGAKFEDIKSGTVKSVIPTKYNDPKTSPLRYTVASGKQTKDFELTD